MVPSFGAGRGRARGAGGIIEKSLYMVFCDRFATLHIRKTRRYVIRDTRCTTGLIPKSVVAEPLDSRNLGHVFLGEFL